MEDRLNDCDYYPWKRNSESSVFSPFFSFASSFKTFAHLDRKRPYLQNRTFRLYVWTFFRIGKIYRSNGTFYLTLPLIMLNHPWIISLFQLFAQQIYAHLKRQNIRTKRRFLKKDTFLLVSHECCVKKKSVDTEEKPPKLLLWER